MNDFDFLLVREGMVAAGTLVLVATTPAEVEHTAGSSTYTPVHCSTELVFASTNSTI